MTQARRKKQYSASSSSSKKPVKHGLQEIVFIFFCFLGLYLFVSLFTYNPMDPGWSRDFGEVEDIRNKGGIAGGMFADIFFYLFGYFAYLFPFMVGYVGWLLYKERHHAILAEPKSLIIPSIGFILTLSAGCGLAIVHFAGENILLPSHAGGILGMAVGKTLESMVDQLGATLVLIAVFFTGVTLLTGLSWLRLMDTLGFYTLQYLPTAHHFLAKQILPYILLSFRQSWRFLKQLFLYISSFGAHKWQNWQERRAQRKAQLQEEEDEYFEDDYDYEDEYFERSEFVEPQQATAALPSPVAKTTPEVVAQPTLDATSSTRWKLPPLDLLDEFDIPPYPVEHFAKTLQEAFVALKIEVEIKTVYPGPVLVGFEVLPLTSVENNLEQISNGLAQALNVPKVKIVSMQTGEWAVEIPNLERQTIYFKSLLAELAYQQHKSPLTVALGEDASGQAVIVDLLRLPHILMAGGVDALETAITLHTLLLSTLYKATPNQLRLLVIDNKDKELALYADLPHLISPVVLKPYSALKWLNWSIQEMERRYRLMAEIGVRNIEGYNELLTNAENMDFLNSLAETKSPLPYILIVVSELAELITHSTLSANVETSIVRLTQKARAAGIHLILATQYPTNHVLTNAVKSNIPTRIAFQMNSKTESRLVLGQIGAETLLGEGDMLYVNTGTALPARVHGSYVATHEVERVVHYWKTQGIPDYVELIAGVNE